MTEYFPSIPSTRPISEKISVHYIRISNNYFLNEEPNEINEEFDEPFVKPLVKINLWKHKEHRDKNKDIAAKIKKIVWVNNSDEDYATDFKLKITRNEYSSIAAAYKDAQKIYSEHCPDYQSGKAVESSVGGVKQVKKKTALENPVPVATSTQIDSTPTESAPTIRKEVVLETLRELLNPLREIQSIRSFFRPKFFLGRKKLLILQVEYLG